LLEVVAGYEAPSADLHVVEVSLPHLVVQQVAGQPCEAGGFVDGLANAAGDRLLGASILDAMSHQATYTGRFGEAANLARAARTGTSGIATATLTAHFHTMEARALAPAVPESLLIVVRGGSSTGKTRAVYEAVADRLADWQLGYPLNVAALKERLDAEIPRRTVLWLGKLRQYVDADGGPAVLGRLADLLHGEGRLLITNMWPEQWTTYTAAARAGPGTADLAGTAGRLLQRLPELTGATLRRSAPPAAGSSTSRPGSPRPR
jgi:AcrR family transcriptional regulator